MHRFLHGCTQRGTWDWLATCLCPVRLTTCTFAFLHPRVRGAPRIGPRPPARSNGEVRRESESLPAAAMPPTETLCRGGEAAKANEQGTASLPRNVVALGQRRRP